MKPAIRTIADQPSWVIRSEDVELAVTQLGGHMAPVTFYRRGRECVQPYYISPWQGERLKLDVPVLVPLRGDFFCMPFGGGCEFRGERHDVHGEPAGRRWTLAGAEKIAATTTLTLRMRLKARPGRITKRLSLVDGQSVVYCQHVVEGFAGPTTLGHHATLRMSDQAESVLVSTSPIRFGSTNPVPTSSPPIGEYQSLAVNKRFTDPAAVPLIWREPRTGDCTRFPTRKGFADLLGCFDKSVFPAWTAAAFVTEGFVWFSLKDPVVLPMTLFWIENHGRHQPPWNGRNCCLGLEDVCGFFAEGLAPSARPNSLTRAGIPTTIVLSARHPTAINYIQGVVRVPKGFGKVKDARFAPGQVTFISATGKKVTLGVRHEFLKTGRL